MEDRLRCRRYRDRRGVAHRHDDDRERRAQQRFADRALVEPLRRVRYDLLQLLLFDALPAHDQPGRRLLRRAHASRRAYRHRHARHPRRGRSVRQRRAAAVRDRALGAHGERVEPERILRPPRDPLAESSRRRLRGGLRILAGYREYERSHDHLRRGEPLCRIYRRRAERLLRRRDDDLERGRSQHDIDLDGALVRRRDRPQGLELHAQQFERAGRDHARGCRVLPRRREHPALGRGSRCERPREAPPQQHHGSGRRFQARLDIEHHGRRRILDPFLGRRVRDDDQREAHGDRLARGRGRDAQRRLVPGIRLRATAAVERPVRGSHQGAYRWHELERDAEAVGVVDDRRPQGHQLLHALDLLERAEHHRHEGGRLPAGVQRLAFGGGLPPEPDHHRRGQRHRDHRRADQDSLLRECERQHRELGLAHVLPAQPRDQRRGDGLVGARGEHGYGALRSGCAPPPVVQGAPELVHPGDRVVVREHERADADRSVAGGRDGSRAGGSDHERRAGQERRCAPPAYGAPGNRDDGRRRRCLQAAVRGRIELFSGAHVDGCGCGGKRQHLARLRQCRGERRLDDHDPAPLRLLDLGDLRRAESVDGSPQQHHGRQARRVGLGAAGQWRADRHGLLLPHGLLERPAPQGLPRLPRAHDQWHPGCADALQALRQREGRLDYPVARVRLVGPERRGHPLPGAGLDRSRLRHDRDRQGFRDRIRAIHEHHHDLGQGAVQ